MKLWRRVKGKKYRIFETVERSMNGRHAMAV
jgi:hypothetical protein